MHKLYLLLFLLLLASITRGQVLSNQVYSTSGKHITSEEISLQFTIGEPCIAFSKTENIVLNEGFCQPYFDIVNFVSENQKNETLEVFPNPTLGIAEARFKSNIGKSYFFHIYDTAGNLKKIITVPVTNKKSEFNINLKDYNSGTYILALFEDNELLEYSYMIKL